MREWSKSIAVRLPLLWLKVHRSTVPSRFTLSTPQQVKLCIEHDLKHIWVDKQRIMVELMANCMAAVVVGTAFYRLPDDTSSFDRRGSVILTTLLLCASCVIEV
jgi:ATP-binding cassette, subfamily G (WHITE), member 2, PDR